MAIKDIRWKPTGGIVTAFDPSLIADNEVPLANNCIMQDGTVRLDQRYRSVCDIADQFNITSPNVNGSGYGKYGDDEQYVIAISGKLYLIDLTSGVYNPTRKVYEFDATEVIGSTYSDDNKDWFFQQFQEYIYGVNPTHGFYRKLIGAGTDGTGNWTRLANPTGPASAPVIASNINQTPVFSSVVQDLAGSTFGGSPAGTDVYIAGSAWTRTLTATHDGNMTFDVTFASAIDLSYSDVYRIFMHVPNSVNWTLASFRLIIGGSYSSEAIIWSSFVVDSGLFADLRMSNIARSSRTAVQGLSVTLTPDRQVPNGSYFTFGFPYHYGVWMTIDSSTNPGAGDPTFQALIYEYTYYNSTTGLESLPSPQAILPASGQGKYGQWENITVAASAQSGVDKIRIYRVVTNTSDGSVTRYRLTEVNNAGQTFVDKRPLEEVEALPIFTPFIIPVDGFTAIAAWQDRLVVAVETSAVYISREGDATSFTEIGDVFDVTDAARARSFYADDNRSEIIYGLCAQDALYIIMNRSIRALYGSNIDDWRLERMPETEGAYGNRSWWPFRNGALVHTPSYNLKYVNVRLGATEEVSRKLRPKIGNPGLGASRLVAVRPNGEIEVRRHNDSGPTTHSYRILDVDGNWRGGNHVDETHSFLYVPGLPIRWVGVNGKLYEGGDDDFQDDDGVPVFFAIRSKTFEIPRSVVKDFYIGISEQVVNPLDTSKAMWPKITVGGDKETSVDDPTGWATYYPKFGNRTVMANHNAKGATIWFQVEGDKDTVLKRFDVKLDPVSSAGNT